MRREGTWLAICVAVAAIVAVATWLVHFDDDLIVEDSAASEGSGRSASLPDSAQPVPNDGGGGSERPEAGDTSGLRRTEASSSAARSSRRLYLAIFHADGATARNAAVAFAPGDETHHGPWTETRASTAGTAEIDGVDGPIWIWIGGVWPWPSTHVIDPGFGSHEIRLPQGHRIAGRVLVDD